MDMSEKENALEEQVLGVEYLCSLFNRHAVPARQRSTLFSEITGLKWHPAHRRVRGVQEVSFEELSKVGAFFGESLTDVLLLAAGDGALAATFKAGESSLKCSLWRGDALPERPSAGPVCFEVEGKWTVTAAVPEDLAGTLYAVKRVLMQDFGASQVRRRVAVLDDQSDITASVCESLTAAGFAAQGFHRIDDLKAKVAAWPYDAYILDWIVGEETVRSLIAELRMHSATAPIAVLTGQVLAGRAVATDIADTLATHQAVYFEKPVTMPIVIATLARLLNGRPSQS